MNSWRYRAPRLRILILIHGIKRAVVKGVKFRGPIGGDGSRWKVLGTNEFWWAEIRRIEPYTGREWNPACAYAYASIADLHSNCRTTWQTCHYDSVRNRAMAAKETSASRNEVPKSLQSNRKRSIIEIGSLILSISPVLRRQRCLWCIRLYTHKCTRYHRKWTQGCGRSDNTLVVMNSIILN